MLIDRDSHDIFAPESATSAVEHAAGQLLTHLPADQALGLRILSMARAAAGMHMAASVETTSERWSMNTSQARGLGREVAP